MIFVMIKQHSVMCVAALMAMVKFSGVEFEPTVMQTIKVGLVEVNISIITTSMNSGRREARGRHEMELALNLLIVRAFHHLQQ